MSTTLQERLAKALSQIRNPRTGADIYSTQQVRDIGASTDGRVHLTLLLTKDLRFARSARSIEFLRSRALR